MAGNIHGGRASDSRTMTDGINMGWARRKFECRSRQRRGRAGSRADHVGRARRCGNRRRLSSTSFRVTVATRSAAASSASGATDAMQGSNYTQKLKDLGLRSPQELIKVWEINPMGGGPILRNRLWFYLTYREVYSENTVPACGSTRTRVTRRSGCRFRLHASRVP